MTLEAWVKPSTVSNTWRDVRHKGDDYLLATSTSVLPGRRRHVRGGARTVLRLGALGGTVGVPCRHL